MTIFPTKNLQKLNPPFLEAKLKPLLSILRCWQTVQQGPLFKGPEVRQTELCSMHGLQVGPIKGALTSIGCGFPQKNEVKHLEKPGGLKLQPLEHEGFKHFDENINNQPGTELPRKNTELILPVRCV